MSDRGAAEVRVDPAFDALYHGYYMVGLRSLFGSGRIFYSSRGFPQTDNRFAFVVEPEGYRICIDTQDRSALKSSAIEWCDVYGKINVEASVAAPPGRARLVPIGPSFGVRAWGAVGSLALAGCNRLRVGKRLDGTREFFANFWRQYHYRVPIDAYTPGVSEPDFAFFMASLWAEDPRCNQSRASFIEACARHPRLRFEGGFAPRTQNDMPEWASLTIQRRYRLTEYLRAMKRSAFVFNTPAVLDCLGWKLGEYLALGKAIISTPLSRILPAPLEHGKHVHFVDGSPKGIREAIDLLLGDAGYRRRLENGARAYFDQHLSPNRVIDRLVSAARDLR